MKATGRRRGEPLLVEIGCEEIPARFLDGARDGLGEALHAALAEARLLAPPASAERTGGRSFQCYSTPRRLVAFIPVVALQQPDLVEEVLGPSVKVGLDARGKPTRAADSFARKNGAKAGDLVHLTTPKGEYLGLKKVTPGRPAQEILAEILPAVITSLTFQNSMYWATKAGPRFVRPIRWILALFGEGKKARVPPFEIAGVKAGEFTFGHRAAGKGPTRVRSFAEYAEKLREQQVEFDPERRRKRIQQQSKVLLEDSGLNPVKDEELENSIVNSCEWPCCVLGGFDERYLRIPREVLVAVMRDQQKDIAVEDRKGTLQPRFIAVTNVEGDPKGWIRQGHERVLAARFSDAEYFWNADQGVSLADRQKLLGKIIYQAELGSYGDKVGRMKSVASELCELLEGQAKLTPRETEQALRAVELSKCDLTTQVVREFPTLQGVVGGLYAQTQGEPQEVHQAIYDHYHPVSIEDRCPRSLIGAVVSLADKIESVVSGFALGLEPTGSSDPFALRRQGNGIVKVLVEFSLAAPLRQVVQQVLNLLNIEWRKPQFEVFQGVLEFLGERLRYYLEDVVKLRYDTVRAVFATDWETPVEVLRRAEALEAVRDGADFEALSAAAKRIRNILTKSATTRDWEAGEVDVTILERGAEDRLFREFERAAGKAGSLAQSGQYQEALRTIATLRPAVDEYFDKVLVMAEEPALRQNRLRLLAKLDQLFSSLAQLSEIAPGPAHVDAST